MNIDQLRTFQMVAKMGNFTKAGRELFLTQPAVSQHIQALENHYSTILFDRTGKKITLTRTGEVLLSKTAELLEQFNDIEVLFEQIDSLKGGRLAVAATAVIGTYILPRVIGEFNQSYPGVELDLSAGNTHHVASLVLEKKADFGFAGKTQRYLELETLLIHTEPLQVVVAASHPLVQKKKVSVDDLIDVPFIWREQGTQTRESVIRWFSERSFGKQLPPKFIELENVETAKHLVAEGYGITVIPGTAVQDEIAQGRLVPISLEGFQENVDFFILFHCGRVLSKASLEFLKMMAEDTRLSHAENILDLLG